MATGGPMTVVFSLTSSTIPQEPLSPYQQSIVGAAFFGEKQNGEKTPRPKLVRIVP